MRPPTLSNPSDALWSHIFRQEKIGPLLGSDYNPPITPIDRNATSTRVLLHDTQAHLEKFTEVVTKLTRGIEETKREIKSVNTLFERDREALSGDIIDLGAYSPGQGRVPVESTEDCMYAHN
ncbi:hypothetical protein BDQ12DRAFT_681758 [Crucibulum laeve]|uniref:Uncharacterized protein n=1 Tax=Crucibulum laeve TaxID=68775 RepID=A0A5C3M6E5_9AGAR|nr:hypothetical protein BDQ12DRAFT_681758 [Crucibulum laeve]